MKYKLTPKILETVGANLRKIRLQKELTQEELSASAEIESSYYARIERGEAQPSLEIIYSILRALGIKSRDILPF